ncbi:MAG: heterodisulfide reductase-related iron-sulfur binding cluster [Bacteroidota bacterium]
MTIGSTAFLLVILCALAFFAWNIRTFVRYLKLGREENRFDEPGKRIARVLRIAFGQTKLLREPLAGSLHFLIFWGFVILLAAVLESIGEGIFPGFSFSFLGPLYGPILFLQDLFGLLVLVAVLVSLYRRLFLPPKRLDVSGHAKWDAVFILFLILVVMVTMFGQNATRMLAGYGTANEYRFVSAVGARMLSGTGSGFLEGRGLTLVGEMVTTWYHIFFWAHMLAVLGFLNYLPYSKHFHVITSVPNVYLSSLGPKGALRPIDLMDESLPKYGATDMEDFSWKQLLDGYTCTECGRCTAACPANTTGKLLSPKQIMVQLRARTMEKAPLLTRGEGSGEDGDRKKVLNNELVHNYISEQELWACTTCMACVQECPVMIEHLDTIVDLRRGLVLNESRFPEELKTTFSNLERNFTPWAFAHASRADWAEGLDVPLMADVQRADVLFWVGCAGAYDARYKKVSRAVVRLLKTAGVDFAVLGTEEKCNGDPARRMGNEYLAQSLITENVAVLEKYQFNRVVVTCPHCLQSLGKEYRQFGGSYAVVHHSTFLKELVDEGRIPLPAEVKSRIVFHDPCYLGRYSDEYDAPRALLERVSGTRRLEMERTRDRSFCCGAGGGRMWMEETEGKRVNIERTEEALRTSPDVIGTGCPFCMTMLVDGVKEKEASEKVEVKDIAEILLEASAPRSYEGRLR